MAAPAIIETIFQKTEGDCAIAALAMLLGVPYVTVSETALTIKEDPLRDGLYISDIQRVAKKLGQALQSVKPASINLSEETGILFLRRPAYAHTVVLFQGVVYNPSDGMLWDLDTFVHTNKYRIVRLLRV